MSDFVSVIGVPFRDNEDFLFEGTLLAFVMNLLIIRAIAETFFTLSIGLIASDYAFLVSLMLL